MFFQQEKLLKSYASKSANRNGVDRRRVQRQFEQLEARTVLSASFGSLTAEYDAGYPDARASSFLQTTRRADYPEKLNEAPIWDNSAAMGTTNRPIQLAQVDAPTVMLIHVGWRTPQYYVLRSPGYVLTVFLPSIRPGISSTSTPRGVAESVSIPKPIAAYSPFPSLQDQTPSEPPWVVQLGLDPVGSPAAGLFDARSVANTNELSSSTASVRGRDSVFQVYSGESLLLTTFAGESTESDDDRIVDDLRLKTDSNESLFEGFQEFEFDSDDVSLDALQQEHEAIDAVFSKLNDLPAPHITSKSRTTDDLRDPHAVSPNQTFGAIPPYNAADLPSVPGDIAAGGMVLLEATSDANLHPYDLLEVVAGRIDRYDGVALGVEAPVGMVHALDVGATDTPSNASQPPASTPSAAARPGASAETAAGNSSAQPS